MTIWIICTTGKGERLPAGRVVMHPRFSIIEADIINTVALLFGGALYPMEVLLRMVGDLHRRLSGDEVPRDVLPVTAAIHVQTTEELPVVKNIEEVRMNMIDKKLYLIIIYIYLIIILR
jgi:hypothetical protein